MKNKWFIASILIVVLIGVCGASVFAFWQGLSMAGANGFHLRAFSVDAVEAKTTEEKNLTVSGPVTLTLENDLGDVSVQTGADGQVKVEAEKSIWGSNEADAQARLKNVKVVVEKTENNIHISVQQPLDIEIVHFGHSGGRVKLTITVPKETAATLHSSNGNVALDGSAGSADVQSNFGDVTITNVSGEILGKSDNGKVTVRNIPTSNKIALSSEFGSIILESAKSRDVSATSANGQIDLTDVQTEGLLKAESQFGDVHISNSRAQTAQVKSNNGVVRLEKLNIDGVISVQSDFGSLILTEINAKSYDLTTQNGKIGLDGARGAIKAHSDFGGVSVVNAQNATIDLSSNNGEVVFSGSLGAGPHKLKSDFGNILVTLPAESALKVDLQTDFGKVSSDFSITLQGEISDKHWTGSINGGGATLTVKTNNGNITLQSSK